MGKLKVLESIQAYMVRIGLHSYNLTEPNNEFFRSIGAYYILSTSVLVLILSSAVYVFKNVSDFEDVSEPLFVILAGVQIVCIFSSVGLNMKTIKGLQIELQALVDEGRILFSFCILSCLKLNFQLDNGLEILNIYCNVEQKCTKVIHILGYYFWFFPMMYASSVLYSLYSMYIGNFDTSTWILPYKMSFPFTSESILVWYFVLFVQSQCGVAYALPNISVISYFIGCCYYIIGICDHNKSAISSIEENVKRNEIEQNAFNRADRNKKIREQFSTVLEIHNRIFV